MSTGVAHRKSRTSSRTEKWCGTTFFYRNHFSVEFFLGFPVPEYRHGPWCCGFLKIRSPLCGKRDSPQTSRAPTGGHPRQRVLTQILKCQSPSIFTCKTHYIEDLGDHGPAGTLRAASAWHAPVRLKLSKVRALVYLLCKSQNIGYF